MEEAQKDEYALHDTNRIRSNVDIPKLGDISLGGLYNGGMENDSSQL